MTGEKHKEPNDMGVFWGLLILTVAEVVVVYLAIPRVLMIIILVMMALVKAGMVAAYFMHLRFERKTLALIVMTPLLLSTLMLVGFVPDASFGPPRALPTDWSLPTLEENEGEESEAAPEVVIEEETLSVIPEGEETPPETPSDNDPNPIPDPMP